MAVTFTKWDSDGTTLLSKTPKSDFSAKVYPLICDRLTITCDIPEFLHTDIIKNFKIEGAKAAANYKCTGLIKELEMKMLSLKKSKILTFAARPTF